MSKFANAEGVNPIHLPSEYQEGLWGDSVIVKDGTDQAGYWHGWCPIHDEVRNPDLPSALFNFESGVMVCQGDPSCHEGQRTMSLTNVLIRMYSP